MSRAPVYLDHNASAPLLDEAREALLATLSLPGNPSSVHGHGRALKSRIETARDQVAQLAGAQAGQVVFTGSATEAITQAIVGGVKALPIDAVVVSAGEHAAVLKAAESCGKPVTTLGLTADGVIDLDVLTGLVQQASAENKVLLVALHAVNNETGVFQPLGRIGALVGPTPHYLFIDAVQALGKTDLGFAVSAADMMAISGHKIGAPAGIGALLMKGHADQVRLIPGGGQELGRRGGTEAAGLIAAFGAAATAFSLAYEAAGVAELVARTEAGLLAMAPEAVIFGQSAARIGNVCNFAVPGLSNATAMMSLDLLGLSVSAGSACSSGKVGASAVLKAMGVAPELAQGALRVSYGWNSTTDDVERFLDGMNSVLVRHRARHGRAA